MGTPELDAEISFYIKIRILHTFYQIFKKKYEKVRKRRKFQWTLNHADIVEL